MSQVESLTGYSYDPETMNFAGRAEGPAEFVPSLGMDVPTFIDERLDLVAPTQAHRKTLMYHVPPPLRGPYKNPIHGEDKNANGFCMCMGLAFNGKREHLTGEDDYRDCLTRAVNRSGYCGHHGGALHPLDKIVVDWTTRTREEQWAAGKLDVAELDDEELARGQVRMANGSFTKAARISSQAHDRMVKELFDRADTKLRTNLVAAVDAMTDIAKGSAYEPADRINAAKWIYERLRGKVPTEIIVSQDKPWEMVMDTIAGGSRAESRQQRQVENAIDAEYVEEAIEADAYHTEGDVDWEDQPSPVKKPGFQPANPNERPTPPEPETSPEDLKKAMDVARRKRYAARARGMEVVEVTPYEITSTPRKKGKSGFVLKFEEPLLDKVPASVLNKEKKQRRKDRYQQ